MGGKENSSSLTFKIENDVAHLAPSDWIKAGHWFVQENYLRIVNDSLSYAHALEHAFRKFPQLNVAGIR